MECGGSGSSDGNSGSDADDQVTISGTAEAPGGVVAYFREPGLLEIVSGYLISPVAAAITGLEPITGATVELIRIDNDGNQIGEVLATTVTSITGDYVLTLPEGTDLSGDLIVRITGAGDTELRAQVVDQEVDISPVTEFVLQKFIAQGSDLDHLTTTSVVKLRGQVEEFDLTADPGADLSDMLVALEQETGEFVDSQIDIIDTTGGDAAGLVGDYRSSGLNISLHDDDGQYGIGTFAADTWISAFSLEDGGAGVVELTWEGEEGAWANLSGSDLAPQNNSLNYYVDIDDDTEEVEGLLTADGLLAVESEFEEEIDGDFAWRWPPTLFRLQRVQDRALFILQAEEAGVRYQSVDTDNNGEKDALDPDEREGDEVGRSIEVFARKPVNMTEADLVGSFGRIYFGVTLNSNGQAEVETETNKLEFDGAGGLDYGLASKRMLSRQSNGAVEYDDTQSEGPYSGIPVVVSSTGDVESIAGEQTDGYINDTYDFFAFASSEGEDGSQGSFSAAYGVKLPVDNAPSVNGRQYRVFFMGLAFSGTAIDLSNLRFNNMLTFSSETVGALTARSSTVSKASLSSSVEVENTDEFSLDASISVSGDGSTTMTLDDDPSTLMFNGYMNADGDLGIFVTTYGEEGQDPEELGLAILVEVDSVQ
ncbi:hypothetical protein [Hahella sp. CCB-MM4]|uniref:hypothetical protein n=1 Tax=Hahella sp. (strain CCB-MM4) TaxID=1926491 RepID=UPI001AEF4144|nr:hypothetical protein [Hahella sp. CCB-MM4]